jgi:hypothetical protein
MQKVVYLFEIFKAIFYFKILEIEKFIFASVKVLNEFKFQILKFFDRFGEFKPSTVVGPHLPTRRVAPNAGTPPPLPPATPGLK